MGVGGFIAAAVLGGGAAYALVRYTRASESASEGPGASSDPCASLKGVSDEAYAACRAANGLWDVVSGIADYIEGENPIDKLNRVNVELNGPTKVPMYPVPVSTAGHVEGGWVALQSRTLEHENGCVPIPGQPGWSKCAPGTYPGVRPAVRRYDQIAADYVPAIHPSVRHEITTDLAAWAKGTAKDPLTGPDITPEGRRENRWWWKGKPTTCPPGQVLSPWSALRDARNLASPVCCNPDGSGAFTANTTGSTTNTSGQATGGGQQSRPDESSTLCTSFFCWDSNPDDDTATSGGGVSTGAGKPR